MSINIDKQKLLIEYLLSSPDTFALCSGIVESEYFDPELKNSVTFVKDYYEKYHSVPSTDQVFVETGTRFTTKQITFDEIQYCSNEVEAFCKRRGLERAILASPPLIQQGDYGAVEELVRGALTISLQRNMGLNYFDDPHKRLLALKNNNSTCSLGYPEVDELLDGGLKRKEMLLLSGNSGAGKSVTMANLALNFMAQGLNVLIISLELSEELIAKRFDTMITGVGSVELVPRMREVATILESKKESLGDLFIVRMPTGSNANSFRAYLKEFELKHKTVPDVLIVDYLDLMSANEYTRPGDTFDKDKRASEQLRDLVHDYNMYLITASQQNRAAVEATDLNHSHIAGGISKINTTDIYISIIMNDQMRARGEIAFQFLKTRSSNGVGKTAHLGWSQKTLRITSNRSNNKKMDFVSKTEKREETNATNMLDLFNIDK